MKIRGSLARNARFGASKSQSGRTFSRFAWQAQYFIEACQDQRVLFAWQAQHFLLIHFAFAWQAQHFVTWRRSSQKSWQGQHLVMSLKNCESIVKVILFTCEKSGFIRKTRMKSSLFTFKVLDGRCFGG